jgi:hypothetical protein
MGSILNSLILVDLGVPPLYETSTSIPLLRPALSLVSSPGHVFFTHDRSYLYHPRMDVYLKLDNIGWFGRVNECNTIVYFTWCIKEMHAVTFCIFWFWHDQHVRDTMEKKGYGLMGLCHLRWLPFGTASPQPFGLAPTAQFPGTSEAEASDGHPIHGDEHLVNLSKRV